MQIAFFVYEYLHPLSFVNFVVEMDTSVFKPFEFDDPLTGKVR
jgi:hypothetical protein